MEKKDLEARLNKLEGRVKALSGTLGVMVVLFMIGVVYGNISLTPMSGAFPKTPATVEAQAFILKDKDGSIRGMWSAEDKTSTFAMGYKEKNPSIVMSVSDATADVKLSDSLKNEVAFGVSERERKIIVGNRNWQTLVGIFSTNKESRIEVQSQSLTRLLTTDPRVHRKQDVK